jgi:hypothetical protein
MAAIGTILHCKIRTPYSVTETLQVQHPVAQRKEMITLNLIGQSRWYGILLAPIFSFFSFGEKNH